MRCHNAKSLISQSFDEPLREFDRSRLEDHLQNCPDCATQLRVLTRGRELLAAGVQQQPSENFEWKVQLGIQKAMRDAARERYALGARSAFWRPMLGGAVGMAALVLALGTWVLPRVDGGSSQGNGEQPVAVSEPDLRGGQPVEIVDPVYVSSRGGQFVSGANTPQSPWEESPSDRDALIKEIQYWRKVAYDQDQLIQRLHQNNEQLKLQLVGDASGQ